MLLIEKCVCFKTGEGNMQKPSLWLLPVDNTTSHIHLPFFKSCFASLFPGCGLVTSGAAQALVTGAVFDPAMSLPFYCETTGSLSTSL